VEKDLSQKKQIKNMCMKQKNQNEGEWVRTGEVYKRKRSGEK
jgi:hypothetical protein